jgi:GntR family transcriptional regulator, transcriptional repressor for pyruvate dehydrogenase complex
MSNDRVPSSSPYRRVKRGRVSDQIVSQMRQLISQGVLKAGQQLPGEHELADKFSTSRPTIREALRTLETMGILDIRTGSGAFVAESPFRSQNLSENLKWLVERRVMVLNLLDVREVLQGLAAKLCAEAVTDRQYADLHATLVDMDAAKDNNDPEQATEADTRFHYLMGEFSNNEILNNLVQHVEQSYRTSSRALMDLGGRAMTSVKEHAAVLSAIKQHDGPLAETQMRAHIASVRAAIAALSDEETVPVLPASSETSGRYASG